MATRRRGATIVRLARRVGRVAGGCGMAVAAGVFAFVGVGPHVAPYRVVTVLTGSMRPSMPPGTLAVVRPVPLNRIGVGDVITYQIPVGDHHTVTHRVVKVVSSSPGRIVVRTQGDANPSLDPWDAELQGSVVWRTRFAVPRVGRMIMLAHSRWVHGLVVNLVPVLVAALGLRWIWGSADVAAMRIVSRVAGRATSWTDPAAGALAVHVDSGSSWHVIPADASLRLYVAGFQIVGTDTTVATMREGPAVIVTVVTGRAQVVSPAGDTWLGPEQAAVVSADGEVQEIVDMAIPELMTDPWLGSNLAASWEKVDAPSAVGGELRSPLTSDRTQRFMRKRRQVDPDGVAHTDGAVSDDHGHDAGFAHQVAGRVVIEDGLHQPRLDAFELDARVAQPRDFDDRLAADPQPGPRR